MTKPNDCANCPQFDKWYGVCGDDDWVNKKTGEYCCRYNEEAIPGDEHWGGLNEI